MNCEFEGCNQKAIYALYELKNNFTKKWVNICREHDDMIALKNGRLQREYPDSKFKEVSQNE